MLNWVSGQTKSKRKFKIIFSSLFLIVFIPTVLLLSFLELKKSGFFLIKDVSFQIEAPNKQMGFYQSLSKKVEHSISMLKGRSYWEPVLPSDLNLQGQNMWIEGYSIYKKFPNQMVVKLKASPILFVYKKNGKSFIYCKNEKRTQILPQSLDFLAVPVIQLNPNDESEQDDILLSKIKDFVAQLPDDGPISLASIRSLRWDNKKGFELEMLPDGVKIYLGHEDVKTRLTRVTRVLSYLRENGIQARVIDSNFLKKVLVKPRSQP